jgi:hypothetical protein
MMLMLVLNYPIPHLDAPHTGKEYALKNILALVGEAFLLRKPKNLCGEGEISRINSDEVSDKRKQKKLIKDNIRIPRLFELIKAYQDTPANTNNVSTSNLPTQDDMPSDSAAAETPETENNEATTTGTPNGVPIAADSEAYEPTIPWTPKKPQNKRLLFSNVDGQLFSLSDDNDEDVKIKFIIRELRMLNVTDYPYSCSSLFRLLLEAVSKASSVLNKLGAESTLVW